MKQLSLSRIVAAACIVCAGTGAMAAETAQQDKAPARWSQGDSTQQQRMGILKKEIGAAYAEQTAACKRGAAAKRNACMKQARATYDHDNADARRLVAEAPQSSVSERVVAVTPAPAQDNGGMQAGSGAYGSSSGGATGSGQMQSGQSQSGQTQSGQMQSGHMQSGQMQSGVGSGMNQSGAQVNPQTDPQSMQQANPQNQSGMRSNGGAYGNSSNGANSAGQGGMQQSGSSTSGARSGMNASGMNSSGMNRPSTGSATQSQSMGAGTGATQSDQGAASGTVPPVQR